MKFIPTAGSIKEIENDERVKKEEGTNLFMLKLNSNKNKPFSSFLAVLKKLIYS